MAGKFKALTAKEFKHGEPMIFVFNPKENRLALGAGGGAGAHDALLNLARAKRDLTAVQGWLWETGGGIRLVHHPSLTAQHVRDISRALHEHGYGDETLFLTDKGDVEIGRIGEWNSAAFSRTLRERVQKKPVGV